MQLAAQAKEPGAALIVRSVVELGRNLGLTLVAEGVEDAKTLDALALMGSVALPVDVS
jgi:EAL domain-containing protein (putative c-di-GMP-specific phosphodiesterase class I)